MNARMRTDLILSTIAGMAQVLEPHYPEYALNEVCRLASDALCKWPASLIVGRKAARYMRRIERKLKVFEGANVFKGATLGGIFNFWLGLLETLHGDTGRKRGRILGELQDLLRDYTKYSGFDDEQFIDEGLRLCKRYFDIMENGKNDGRDIKKGDARGKKSGEGSKDLL